MNRCSMTLTLALTLAAACDASPEGSGDGDGQRAPAATEALGDGAYETVLDATDEAAWTYFDFESRAHVAPADPASDPRWDLGGLRFNLKTNGGTSGSGGAAVAVLDGAAFDDVTAAPVDGYVEDDAQAPGSGGDATANTSPGYAFDDWFVYNPAAHTLAPVPDRVYVVRTPEGHHFKVEMLDYYDDAGTPGFVRFRWKALP